MTSELTQRLACPELTRSQLVSISDAWAVQGTQDEMSEDLTPLPSSDRARSHLGESDMPARPHVVPAPVCEEGTSLPHLRPPGTEEPLYRVTNQTEEWLRSVRKPTIAAKGRPGRDPQGEVVGTTKNSEH